MKQILTTNNYELFKSIDGNRTINKPHLARLKKSIAENYLFTIIVVNEKYEIIDGQHRFTVIKELGLPINYTVCEGYGRNEVHILNANSKNWSVEDYLKGYCELGYKDYLLYKEFKDKYGFGHAENIALLGANMDTKRTIVFNTGEFKVKDYKKANENAEKIANIGKYYDGYKRRSFVYAMRRMLLNPNFNYSEFINKLHYQPKTLVNCVSVDQYIELIEQIYNFKRREKINLRY